MKNERIKTYGEFWDHYVLEHSKPMTRYLHFVGTVLGMVMLIWFFRTGNIFYIPLGLAVGYGFSWFSHFFVEKNKPASFKYPVWSFLSDYKMIFYMLTGRMNSEVDRVLME